MTGGTIGSGAQSGGKQCMQIADLSKMKVIYSGRRKGYRQIAVGQSANVTHPAFRYREPGGTVTWLSPGCKPDSGSGSGGSVTLTSTSSSKQSASRLPGMTAEVSVVPRSLTTGYGADDGACDLKMANTITSTWQPMTRHKPVA